MKGFKSKRGISLIVLVITIIVMIILAAAIILSISNSGIMDKANKAKLDSDTANLKEYANVLEAEWELMTADERSSSGYASKEAYVNKKLADKGYSAAYSAEGEIYTVANDVAKDALSKGLKIGDEVKYTVTSTSTSSAEADNGYRSQTVANKTDFIWRYIGVSDSGELLIAPDMTSGAPKVTLKGKTGYLKGPDELNRICKELYSVSGKGTARSMNIDDVTRILGYTGEKGAYYEPTSETYTPTTEAKKIGDLEKELSTTLGSRSTPESSKNLEDYYSDYYSIYKTNDVKEMKNSKYVDLIYPKSGYYWLASSCVLAGFPGDCAAFCVHFAYSDSVSGQALFVSHGAEPDGDYAVRPVVTITSNIQKSTENGSTVWSFV